MTDKVVLAYSGGLDTSVAIPWLKERGLEVVAVTVDVGQPGDLQAHRQKALRIGASEAFVVDARAEYAESYIARALRANAMYEGIYPLSTALARPLIGKTLVDVARKVGAQKIAHGCTGKGNDQVRFDLCTTSLAADLEVLAPARVWKMTREEEIAYAEARGVPVPVGRRSPYSTDENLWGRSVECGILEDPAVEPPEEAYGWTRAPERAPDTPAYVTIGFDRGLPISIDSQATDLPTLVPMLNRLAGDHGVGRIDHVESRVVGIKSREVYECPAALTLIPAHQALEALVLPRDLLDFKRSVEQRYSQLIYDGLWFTPLREALDAFLASTQTRVTGEVVVKLYKGASRVVGRRSAYALYQHELATYAEGDRFRNEMAEGFIYVWGLPARTWASLEERAGPSPTPVAPVAPPPASARTAAD
ncbi:MAG: argininosuccinate synthase [Thermoplasmata archaeon]